MPKMYKMKKVCTGYAPAFAPVVPCGVLMEPLEWEAAPGEPEPTGITHGMCEDCLEKQKVVFQNYEVSKP